MIAIGSAPGTSGAQSPRAAAALAFPGRACAETAPARAPGAVAAGCAFRAEPEPQPAAPVSPTRASDTASNPCNRSIGSPLGIQSSPASVHFKADSAAVTAPSRSWIPLEDPRGVRANGASQRSSTVQGMDVSHRDRVEGLLSEAADEHARLMSRLPADLRASLPVDAQGITQAIDHLATAAGLSVGERRALIRPHAVNPAVLHARVFGPAPLTRETVVASFVEGARVRADALAALADAVGGEELGLEIRQLLLAHPPPVRSEGDDVISALRATYAAQERAAVAIAATLDRA